MTRTPRISETRAAYADVRRVMDAALDSPGLRYVLPTEGKATNFAQRCNLFRKNLRKALAEQLADTPGAIPETIYDSIKVAREGRVITFAPNTFEGEFLDLDGNPIDLPPPDDARPIQPDGAPELPDAAAEAARNLGLDIK